MPETHSNTCNVTFPRNTFPYFRSLTEQYALSLSLSMQSTVLNLLLHFEWSLTTGQTVTITRLISQHMNMKPDGGRAHFGCPPHLWLEHLGSIGPLNNL